MKKISLWLVVIISISLVATFSLYGCKEEVQSTEEEVAEEEVAEEEVAEEEVAEEEVAPVEIIFWWYGEQEFPGMQDWMDENVSLYKEMYPNITIETVLQNSEVLDVNWKGAAEAGKGPDIGMLYIDLFKTNIWLDNLAPMDEYFTEDELKDFIGLGASMYGGKLYGIPWTNASALLYYNRDMFEQVGLDPDSFPTNWADFMQGCQTLDDAGITPYGLGGTDGFHSCMLADLVFDNSINKHYEILEAVLGHASWADPKFLQYFKTVDELKEYINPDALSLDYFQGVELLAQKDVAITLGVNGNGPTWIKDGLMEDGRLGVATVPPYEDPTAFSGTITSVAYDWVLAPWSQNKEEGINFLKFMNSEERLNALYMASGALPASKKFDTSYIETAFGKELFEFPKEASCFQIVVPAQIQYDGLAPTFDNIINGNMTPLEAAQFVDETSEKWQKGNPEEFAHYEEWYDEMVADDY